ncbi:SRPBCC family protein [Rugosimonospora africana]|nr:SRPBCC family protein [Rugosimonospora africana]
MARFSNDLLIQRPVDAVFAYLSDLENLPRWNYAIRQTRRIGTGPIGVGTVYRQVRTLPHPMEESLEITEFAPNRRLVIHGGLGVFDGSLTYLLEPTNDATRLINEIELTGRGARGALAGIAKHSVKQAVAQNLEVLRNLLER